MATSVAMLPPAVRRAAAPYLMPSRRQNSGCAPLPPLVLQAGHVGEVGTLDRPRSRGHRQGDHADVDAIERLCATSWRRVHRADDPALGAEAGTDPLLG